MIHFEQILIQALLVIVENLMAGIKDKMVAHFHHKFLFESLLSCNFVVIIADVRFEYLLSIFNNRIYQA